MKKPVFFKLFEVIKYFFPIILNHWKFISASLSGIIAVIITKSTGLIKDFISINLVIPLWLIIVISPPLVYIIFMTAFETIKYHYKMENYKSLFYGIWRVKWDYEFFKGRKIYDVINLHQVCNKCGMKLNDLKNKNGEYITTFCPACREEYSKFDLYEPVTNIIKDNVDNKTFKTDYKYEIEE